MNKILQLLNRYREIISYLFWGVMTTLVSWGSYSLFAVLFQGQVQMVNMFRMKVSMAVILANVLSWILSVIFAFVVNKIWVFQSKSWKSFVWMRELWRFLSARIVTGVLEIVAVPLLVGLGLDQTLFGVEGMVSKVLVSVMVVLLNYVFSKLFIFK